MIRTEHRHLKSIKDADVLVVHSPIALSLPAVVAARISGRPVVSFVWDVQPPTKGNSGAAESPAGHQLLWLLESIGLLFSSRIVTSTEDYRPFLGRLGRGATVVPLWPSDPVVEVSQLPEHRDQSTLRLGFAGQINSIRGVAEGIDRVLECWQGGAVELHVFSADVLPEPLTQRASSDRRLTVVEHGFTPPDRLQGELARLDLGWVCLHPTFHLPAFPSKIVTYLCAGLPVLYTGPDLPALTRWFDDYKLGLRTKLGGTIAPDDVVEVRRRLQHRRDTYFAKVEDEVSSLLDSLG